MKECEAACSRGATGPPATDVRVETWIVWARARSAALLLPTPSGPPESLPGSGMCCRWRRGRAEISLARSFFAQKLKRAKKLFRDLDAALLSACGLPNHAS